MISIYSIAENLSIKINNQKIDQNNFNDFNI